MAGHKRTVGDELLCESSSNTKKLGDRLRRQRLKNGKKGMKSSIRRYLGCDVTSMPKEPTWSLSTALYAGSTKPTHDR